MDLLRRSFDLLIARHEILRTVFVTIDGEPKQKIIPEAKCNFHIQFQDLRQFG